MDKFDQAIDSYKKCFSDVLHRSDYNEDLLISIAKSLGPSIYASDSSKVACSDKKELDQIKYSFLIKKLRLKDGPKLDKAIKEACQKFGSSNRNKLRVVFYYLLVENFNKQAIFIMKAQEETQKEKTEKSTEFVHDATSVDIISNHALYAAGFGLIPIPIVDLVSISAIQYKMIKEIAGNYPHVTFSKSKTQSVLTALAGSLGSIELGIMARYLLKGIPFFGSIIGGTAVAGFAYLSTKFIGEIFDDHFASGGDLSIEELTLEKMKNTFKYRMNENKASV